MKTKIKLFALISTSCLMLALPVSCNSTTKNDPKTLNVVLYNAGWGDEWFKDVIAKWENNNPGYTVNLTSKYEVKELIKTLGLNGKVLFITANDGENLYLATRNLGYTYSLMSDEINCYDLVNADIVVIEEEAVKKIEEALK